MFMLGADEVEPHDDDAGQATARIVTLMTPAEKARLESKARRANLSLGEFIRRAVEAYDPQERDQLVELAELACRFREGAERASAAVDRANANVRATVGQLARERNRPLDP